MAKEGCPWTAGGTLPEGETETGVCDLLSNSAGCRIEEIIASLAGTLFCHLRFWFV
jgi:hypothetical protein